MDGQIDGLIYRQIDGWIDILMDRWLDREFERINNINIYDYK